MRSAAAQFRKAVDDEKPLQVVGTLNAYSAILAKSVGYKAVYLSGAGVANVSYGLPDLALTTLDNVLEDARRIIEAVDLPLLIDIDTGWGGALMISRVVKAVEKAGVAALHIEDQEFHKRCGHRPGKAIVSAEEMADRIKAAVDAREDEAFTIIARTDSYASEGMEGAVERALLYKEAGADMIFAEAFKELDDYKRLKQKVALPILANITEFGKTPLFSLDELSQADVDIALYPLSAARAMHQAALDVYREIREKGTQKDLLEKMQTREELYSFLGYKKCEEKIDRLYQL